MKQPKLIWTESGNILKFFKWDWFSTLCCRSGRRPLRKNRGADRCEVLHDYFMYNRRNKSRAMITLVQSKIGFPCPCCGVKMVTIRDHPAMATIEHVKPLGDYGTNSKNNLEVICLACNRARNFVKQYFDGLGQIVPVEYWQCSLRTSLLYIVNCFYEQYHKIFLNARFG